MRELKNEQDSLNTSQLREKTTPDDCIKYLLTVRPLMPAFLCRILFYDILFFIRVFNIFDLNRCKSWQDLGK